MKFRRRFSDAHRKDLLEKSQKCIRTKDGLPGFRYLIEKRKLSKNVIKAFGLGYIPAHVPHQLAGRVIFPLYDPSSNLIVLTSRNVDGGDFLPVYWHEHYKKSFYLYGLNNAKEAMRKWKFVVVVEGQVDVLQLNNHGVENVVGLGSTNLSGVQLAMIHRYCDRIILMLDSDINTKAGQIGTTTILETTRIRQKPELDSFGEVETRFDPKYNITSVSLPLGKDPDSYILEYGMNSLKKLVRRQLSKI